MPADPPTHAKDLRGRLQADLRDALKGRDRTRTSVIRTALAALANAEAVEAQPVTDRSAHPQGAGGLYAAEVERRALTDDETRRVLGEVHDDLLRSADELAGLARVRQAEELRAEADILAAYVA
jgi:uncharacterized protein